MAPPEKRDPRLGVLTLALDAGSGYGGAEKLAYEFARRLDPERFASYLCTIRAAFPDRESATVRDRAELAAAGVRFVELNERRAFLATPGAWRGLYGLLRREAIDVVHAHMPRATVPGTILARLARVPVVISHEHGSALGNRRVRAFIDREIIARLSTVMLAVSEWDRANLIEHEGISADLIRVLPNGIAPLLDAVAGPAFSLPADRPLVGAVGRLYPEKGYDVLIRAVALLRERGRRLFCAVVGVGPEQAVLQRLIDELGAGEDVQLLGRRDDVGRIIRELDVAVLSSVREGSPLAMLEYMAAGAPIVATRVGGVPELIADGVHGLLVPAKDPPALAAGIERLLDDRILARRLGAAAQLRQRSEFDLGVVVTRLERLYVELYERSRRASGRRTIEGNLAC